MSKRNTFLGSEPFVHHVLDYSSYYLSKFKKYGLTYGRYEGIAPVVCTIDPEIIKSVTMKNGDSFQETFKIDLEPKYITLDVSGGE